MQTFDLAMSTKALMISSIEFFNNLSVSFIHLNGFFLHTSHMLSNITCHLHLHTFLTRFQNITIKLEISERNEIKIKGFKLRREIELALFKKKNCSFQNL